MQPLAQEDIEAFLGYTIRMLKVQVIRKLSFVALKPLIPPSEHEAESVQPVFLLILIYVYRHCVIISLLHLPRYINASTSGYLVRC